MLYGVYSGGTKPGMRCVKKGDWKLIKYDVMDGATRETQLFNLDGEPGRVPRPSITIPQVIALTGVTPAPSQRNLADDPRYADKLAEMEALLLAEMRRSTIRIACGISPTTDFSRPRKASPPKSALAQERNDGPRSHPRGVWPENTTNGGYLDLFVTILFT